MIRTSHIRNGNCLIDMYLNYDSRNGSDGPAFALCAHRMTSNLPSQDIRWKAVWGPKRLMATLALLVFGFGSHTFAGQNTENPSRGPHDRLAVAKARSGRPNSRVSDYKVDGDLVRADQFESTLRHEGRNARQQSVVAAFEQSDQPRHQTALQDL